MSVEAAPTAGRDGREPFNVEEAYREHASALFGFAVNALGDRAEAEEVVQEVFTRAWRSSAGYDPSKASVRTWLFAIARNLVTDTFRARSRRPRLVETTSAGFGEGEPDAGPEGQVETRMQIVEALARLSPEHREVVVAVHLEATTYAQLSQRSGVAVATLRTRMYYGIRAMRATLDEAGWTDDD